MAIGAVRGEAPPRAAKHCVGAGPPRRPCPTVQRGRVVESARPLTAGGDSDWNRGSDTYVYSDTVVYTDFMIDSPTPRLTRRESQERTRRRLVEAAAELSAARGGRATALIGLAL